MKVRILFAILLISFFLRIVYLNSSPPSMYWEEVALGYDAFSILKTGKDHHGNILPLVAFESFGDYKPSFYFYSIIPFIPLFGLSVWAVRMPSVIAGVLIVFFTGKIVELLFVKKEKDQKKTSFFEIITQPDILTMLVLSFSPWALQFSRGGWEVNLATAMLTIGVFFGLKGALIAVSTKVEPKRILFFYLISVIFLVSSTYTYHAMRIIAPLLGLVIALPLVQKYKTYWKQASLLAIIGLFLMLPILVSIKDPEVTHRLQETSTFSEGREVLQSNEYIQKFGSSIFAKAVFHRYWFYLRTMLLNAFSHLNLKYLFITGDINGRHSIQYFGLFFPTDFFVLIAGVVAVMKRSKKRVLFLLAWFMIGLIPASISFPVPHALRTLAILPVFAMLLGYGFSTIFEFIHNQRFSRSIGLGVVAILLGQLVMYWHYYLLVYPKQTADQWQYGYEKMVQSIETHKKPDEQVFITREHGRPAMYFWFFTQTNPEEVQAEDPTALQDQGEYLQFKNISFLKSFQGSERGLIASTPEERKSFTSATEIETVYDLRGKPVWVIYRVE